MIKVCIPSKERASEMTTHLFFNPIDVLIFVEPQEIKKYKIHWPEYTFIDIKKTNQGFAYVMNFIIDYSKEDKIIIIDDDVSYFAVREEERYRYSKVKFNNAEFLKDVEDVLEKEWSYTVPSDSFSFFTNKNTNNRRFFYNRLSIIALAGLNLKEIKKHNILYDKTIIDGIDHDFSMQIIMNGGNVCSDYKYSFLHLIKNMGGISSFRGFKMHNSDNYFREGVYNLSKKYGPEFIKIMFDADGYITNYNIKLSLIAKRKDLAKRNVKKYLSEKTP